jgi:hypothetical protein
MVGPGTLNLSRQESHKLSVVSCKLAPECNLRRRYKSHRRFGSCCVATEDSMTTKRHL